MDLVTGLPAQTVVIMGQGYVGLPLAMEAVSAGYTVVGYEPDAARAALLASGESFVEDVPGEALSHALAAGRYTATGDPEMLRGFDIAVITVPTPLSDGNPDLSYVEDAARSLGACLKPGALVVLESTTYPGTTEELLVPCLEQESGLAAGADFLVGYSPERIDPGNQTYDVRTTPKVISGIDPASLAAVDGFYSRLVERTVPVSSPAVAELTKLLENTFRHVNIALVNELAMFASDLGVDIWEAIDAASTKPFGYLRFTPGPGVGGHCLPIDPSYLSWRVRRQLGRSFRFVELANDVNDHMPDYVVTRLLRAYNCRLGRIPKGSRVLLLGLAYKKNTGDLRESPALRVAELLLDLGVEVQAADPHVTEGRVDPRIRRVAATAEAFAAADAVVVLTDHDAFDFELLARTATYVLDTRNVVRGPAVERL